MHAAIFFFDNGIIIMLEYRSYKSDKIIRLKPERCLDDSKQRAVLEIVEYMYCGSRIKKMVYTAYGYVENIEFKICCSSTKFYSGNLNCINRFTDYFLNLYASIEESNYPSAPLRIDFLGEDIIFETPDFKNIGSTIVVHLEKVEHNVFDYL